MPNAANVAMAASSPARTLFSALLLFRQDLSNTRAGVLTTLGARGAAAGGRTGTATLFGLDVNLPHHATLPTAADKHGPAERKLHVCRFANQTGGISRVGIDLL